MAQLAKSTMAPSDTPIPPWKLLSTRQVATMTGVDCHAFAQRKYRGLTPEALPNEWFKGRNTAYFAADVQTWLGDPPTLHQIRMHVLKQFGADAGDADDNTIRWFMMALPNINNSKAILGNDFSLKFAHVRSFKNNMYVRLDSMLSSVGI
jgi:hypothetical protein